MYKPFHKTFFTVKNDNQFPLGIEDFFEVSSSFGEVDSSFGTKKKVPEKKTEDESSSRTQTCCRSGTPSSWQSSPRSLGNTPFWF